MASAIYLRLINQTYFLLAAIQAGASHLTIHGRTRLEPSTVAPSLPGIAFAASLAHAQGIPTIGNGDIWTAQDAADMRRETGVKGVMAARGLLANPALFSGFDKTPQEAVEVRLRNLPLLPGHLTDTGPAIRRASSNCRTITRCPLASCT